MEASACNNFWEVVTEITTKCTGSKTNMYYMPTNQSCLATIPDNYYSELNVLSPCDPSCSSCTGPTKELCAAKPTNWLLYVGIGAVAVAVIVVIIIFVVKSQ